MLTDLDLKSVYRSGNQNLFKDFYRPTLQHAVRYDRAVGFFSAQTLVSNLQGFQGLLKNDGTMRLIIGHPLEENEFLAVKRGVQLGNVLNDLNQKLDDVLNDISNISEPSLELLSWLIAAQRIEIRFALRRKGMYHEKIGVIEDTSGNKIVFQGSANETVYALDKGFNAESIMVFKNWIPSVWDEYGQPCVDGFERLWLNQQEETVTVEVPSELYEKISKASKQRDLEEIVQQLDDESLSLDTDFAKKLAIDPSMPKTMGTHKFELKQHQLNAIAAWKADKYKGILQLSTGSGKTITSIAAAVKVYEARKSKGRATVLIVSVPYVELATQWVENLALFNIYPIKCFASKKIWEQDLKKAVLDINMGASNWFACVVVNRTMESESFQNILKDVSALDAFVIGDECHNHGAKKTNAALPDAYYRLGLSATPFRSDDEENETPFPNDAKDRIKDYYGNVVANYSLSDAINDGVLCEYNYHIVPVYLTSEEQDEYDSISSEIGALIGSGIESMSPQRYMQFTLLCGRRSRLLGGASNKVKALSELIKDIPANERKHSLFYCGEGNAFSEEADLNQDVRIIEEVSKTLGNAGWATSRFTSDENAQERKAIMKNFVNGDIDALVSMKVLDEGVDVPVCNKAFILASTRNPRQYIQRRGRVLRKSEGKEFANIWDFVILPLGSSESSTSLKKAELERVEDFLLSASNKYQIEQSIDDYGLRG